ncbi:hypothetical protein [Glaciecola sp. SC05]|uniref:hypothetical protein n=1 Tax=Glaciecola sp. SC05 TaxID=1987355 RepID=UPI003527657D
MHPEKQALAEHLTEGLQIALNNGKHQQLIDRYYPNLAFRLRLSERRTSSRGNPNSPKALSGLTPS